MKPLIGVAALVALLLGAALPAGAIMPAKTDSSATVQAAPVVAPAKSPYQQKLDQFKLGQRAERDHLKAMQKEEMAGLRTRQKAERDKLKVQQKAALDKFRTDNAGLHGGKRGSAPSLPPSR